MNSKLDSKLIDADSYHELANKYYNKGEYHEALKCYDKAYILYLDILGDDHHKSIQVSEKVRNVIIKLSA
jgi:tetratricopeptide (TPR) repeat protein